MLNDIIIINATVCTHDSLTHGSTHSENSEANETNKHISMRGDPVSDDLCFFHIKVFLGPREICEQACHLATDQQYGNSSQNFHYLNCIYILCIYIHSLIWKATVHTLSFWLWTEEALLSSTKEETWKTKYLQKDKIEEKEREKLGMEEEVQTGEGKSKNERMRK